MGFADSIIKSRPENVRIYTTQIEGEDAWFIIRLDNNKINSYLRAIESGDAFNLPDYGTVLHKGWGSTPPQDIIDSLEEEFNQ